jgi:hypothetical protein
MNRPDPSDSTHCPLFSERLLDEVHNAQAALAAAEHFISFSPQKVKPGATYHFYATHEALHEARKTIDGVIEMLRTEAARSRQHDQAEFDRPLTRPARQGLVAGQRRFA